MKFFTACFLAIGVYSAGKGCNEKRTQKDKSSCLKHSYDQGSLYSGNVNVTKSGKPCLMWAQPKRAHALVPKEMENGKTRMVPSNYCRNGGRGMKGEIPKRNRPWCMYRKSGRGRRWDYCDIPMCDTPASLRKCNVESVFQNNPLYTSFNFTLEGTSCTMQDQGHLATLRQQGLQFKSSPWNDCGYTYRGQISDTKSGTECQKWDMKYPHKPSIEVSARGNYCTLPDLRSLNCNEENTPWCYTTDENKRYESCAINKCQCGKTGLTYIGRGDSNNPVPSNLNFLLSDSGSEKFAELIPFWNENKPCDKAVCRDMWNVNKNRTRRSPQDSSSYDYSSYDVCESATRKECEKECPEYDEYDETCTAKLDRKGSTNAKIQQRVINGATYVAGTTPWLVALDYKPEKEVAPVNGCYKRWSQFCGGTLIHAQWVLTAAHCMMSDHVENPKQLKIIAGKVDLDGDEFDTNNVHCVAQVRSGRLVLKHPGYKGASGGQDIALIQTNEPFWINSMVNYMCLPPPGWTPEDRATCIISGWGLQDGRSNTKEISQRNQVKSRKKYADSRLGLVRHVEKEECEGALFQAGSELGGYSWEQRTIINATKQLCFGHELMDTCQGDSGGPIICKAPEADEAHELYLAGVVSYGIETLRTTVGADGQKEQIVLKCGKKDVPGVYTKVSAYISWIYEQMDQHQ